MIPLRASGSESLQSLYQSTFLNADTAAIKSPEELEELYAESFEQDLRRKSTRRGIHRDDIEISMTFEDHSQPARTASSQGQARSITLSLKIAAIEFLRERLGESPVILLDDVESELDESRRECPLRFDRLQ